jgi:hypothetical protein
MIFRSVGQFVFEFLTLLRRMWPHLLMVAVLIGVAFFWVEIDPGREYGFGAGVLHGFFGIQNLILSWFTGREVVAPSISGRGYTVGFGVGLFAVPFLIRNTLEIVFFVIKRP